MWPVNPFLGLSPGLSSKESACDAGHRGRRRGFGLWIGKIPRRWKWQPTSLSLPGKFHGQRSLADYSPRDHKESDTTERASRIHSYIRKHSIVKGDWAKSSLAKLFRHFIQEFSASSRWPWILCVSLCLMSSRACALIKGCVLFYSRFKTTWTNR